MVLDIAERSYRLGQAIRSAFLRHWRDAGFLGISKLPAMSQALDKFLQGMSAAVHLLNRAIERRSALECIVLQANLTDGCLRMALILKAQLDSRSNAIDDSLLQQQD